MSILSLSALKALFETGDKPTQSNFADAWDTVWTIKDLQSLPDEASISVDCLNFKQVVADLTSTQTTVALAISDIGKVLIIFIKKDNSSQDITFTLSGTGLVFDIYDKDNDKFTRGTTVTISGTDTTDSHSLDFYNTGLLDGTDKIIQVSGTISSFS